MTDSPQSRESRQGPVGDRAREPGSVCTLAPELIALAQGGCGITVAAGVLGAPIVGLAHACAVRPEGSVRIILSASANRALIRAVDQGSPVAVTFTATRDHTSFQIKTRRARVAAPCSDDLPMTDRQNALFRDGLVELGFSPEQSAGYAAIDPADLAALEIVPERVFSQTPGPGAGRELSK